MEKQKAVVIFEICYYGYGRDFNAQCFYVGTRQLGNTGQLNYSVINMWPAVLLCHDKQMTTSRQLLWTQNTFSQIFSVCLKDRKGKLVPVPRYKDWSPVS